MKKFLFNLLYLILILSAISTSAQTLEQWKTKYENAAKEDRETALKTARNAVK